jgi:error-prone DNA polymerase
MKYAELQITSNFSFLRCGARPHELVEHDTDLGYSVIVVTDRNSFAGSVRANMAANRI